MSGFKCKSLARPLRCAPQAQALALSRPNPTGCDAEVRCAALLALRWRALLGLQRMHRRPAWEAREGGRM